MTDSDELVEPTAFWAFLAEIEQEIAEDAKNEELSYEAPWEELE